MKYNLEYINILAVTFVIGLIIGGIFGHCSTSNKYVSSPVEENVIDSLITTRENIKVKIKDLDSIKDAKVMEVITLDNDSTVKLFYKLVKE